MGRAKVLFLWLSLSLVVSATSELDAQSLSLQEQRRLSLERFHDQWELLKATPAFQPGAFVPGVLRPLDPLSAPRVEGTVFGYYAGGGSQGIDFELLSHLALAFTDADGDGNLVSLPLSSYPGWYEAINEAHDQGVPVVLVVRNRDFDPGMLHRLLASATARGALIRNLLAEVERHFLDGVSVDFENVAPQDRDPLTLFLRELSEAFRARSSEMHVSLAVPAYDGGAFDLPALAEICDALLMMQYVYHGVGSGVAGPQAPIERDGLSLLDSIQREFLAAGVPEDKLVLLLPYYGYQWLVDPSDDASRPGARVAGIHRTVRIDENPFPNMTYDTSIDRRGQYFHYFWTGSAWVQGWADEASSIGKKEDLAQELDLQGVGIWRLEYGSAYPELWNEIEGRFASDCPRRPLSLPSDRWALEIWNNRHMEGSPVERRYDASGSDGFSYDWGGGGPSDCAGTDDYAIRFRRRVSFPLSGTYRFKTVTDDGVRLFVDGVRIVEDWRDMAPTERTAVQALTAGWHELQMDYYENGGGAVAKLSWERIAASCITPVQEGNWKGEYFPNRDLVGSPAMVRDEGAGFLDFDWGSGSPDASCGAIGADDFSARWTRQVSFPGGTYRFTVTADDGFRLYIDGVLRKAAWWDQGPTTYRADVPLVAGEHTIALEYYENGGGAVAKLSWERIAASCITPVPEGNWKGEYFPNRDLVGSPALVRDEGAGFLDFEWGSGSPDASCGAIGADDFSARWTRTVGFDGGTYRFRIESDDGFRLYVGGVLREEAWKDQGATVYTVDVPLAQGDHEIELQYYERGGLAVAKLSWSKVAEASSGWSYPVGAADSGAPWWVSLPLGASWTSDKGIAYRGHLGEDWFRGGGGELGAPVYAAADGKVVTFLNNCGSWVDVVILEHEVPGFSEPMYSFYGHLEANGFVSVGDRVSRRQQIGTVGDPVEFEPHLHFEIKNRTALTNVPFSSCAQPSNGLYIGAGYSGKSNDYGGGDFYDPSNDGVSGNRYYHPSRFVEAHKNGSPSTGPDCADFLADVNVPDGTPMAPGQTFDKGWRLRNCGDTDWSGTYRAVRIAGGYGPASFELPLVARRQDGELWARFVAPSTVGTHRATYQLEGPSGRFGDPFWVEIQVAAPTDCARFLGDLNVPDGTAVSPGQSFDKGWRFGNCGNTAWTSGYRAIRVDGIYGPTAFTVPGLSPGTEGELWTRFTAPTTAGTHRASYRLEGPGGVFGDLFWVEVRVTSPTVVVDDGDAGFQLFGPASYWHRESIGYGGDMHWTYVNGTVVSNKARWRPTLSGAGNYKVQVFIPYDHATSRTARYTIRANGTSHGATIDQSIWYDQWVTLGTFFFHGANDGSEFVELTDATGEAGSTYRKIGFDAVRWVRQ